jgi:enamine deaminase RidA (YjgF/YER057c/UK114 family)
LAYMLGSGLYIDAKDCGKGTAMKIKRHETGSRISKAVIHGDTVYLAGIVADSPKDKSVAEQTRSILSQIDDLLAVAGTNKTKLLSANIWITEIAQTPSAPLPEHQSGFNAETIFASQYTCYRHAKSARGFASELCRVGT